VIERNHFCGILVFMNNIFPPENTAGRPGKEEKIQKATAKAL
jgi:hypothetical protein